MKLIPLTQGKFAQVDDEDFERVSKFKWYASKNYNTFYAMRKTSRKGGIRRYTIMMHRFLMGVDEHSVIVDHVDRDGLKNVRSNLRLCTASENCMNKKPPSNNTSGVKGVSWSKKLQKWKSSIMANGVRIHLGYFDDINLASNAYKDGSKKHHGEFSRINV